MLKNMFDLNGKKNKKSTNELYLFLSQSTFTYIDCDIYYDDWFVIWQVKIFLIRHNEK